MPHIQDFSLNMWDYTSMLNLYGTYSGPDGSKTLNMPMFVNVVMGIVTAIALSYWLSATIPGLDMAVAMLLLSTPMVNRWFVLLCIAQLMYRGRMAPPTQRTKRIPKYL